MEKPEPASKITNEEHHERRMSPFGQLFRFIGWWFGFTGLYTTFAVCPFCGQQGCPVGLASAGTIGLFLALCVQDWKRFFAFIKQNLMKKKK
jgi:hypothetical protein